MIKIIKNWWYEKYLPALSLQILKNRMDESPEVAKQINMLLRKNVTVLAMWNSGVAKDWGGFVSNAGAEPVVFLNMYYLVTMAWRWKLSRHNVNLFFAGVIVHEAVHVDQILSKRKIDIHNGTGVLWEGVEWKNVSNDMSHAYYNYPWEIEAYTAQSKYLLQYGLKMTEPKLVLLA